MLHAVGYQVHHIRRAAPLADLPLLQGPPRDVQRLAELSAGQLRGLSYLSDRLHVVLLSGLWPFRQPVRGQEGA